MLNIIKHIFIRWGRHDIGDGEKNSLSQLWSRQDGFGPAAPTVHILMVFSEKLVVGARVVMRALIFCHQWLVKN